MKKAIAFGIVFVLCLQRCLAQSVVNGDFSAGAANWGCTPETNPESVYGGPTSNTVAELDNLVALCQTINGLTVGTVYNLTYVASRRLGGCPGPNPADISVAIAGLNTLDSRTNTTWAMTSSLFQFTATATSHTLNLASQFPSYTTCGFIIDDIAISVAIPFGMELESFELSQSTDGQWNIRWVTTKEENVAGFLVEYSADGQNWSAAGEMTSLGSLQVRSAYALKRSLGGLQNGFCRLQSVDRDGQVQLLAIRQFASSLPALQVYPNPANAHVEIDFPEIAIHPVSLLNAQGKTIAVPINSTSPNHVALDLRQLPAGMYWLSWVAQGRTQLRQISVQR